MKDDNIKCKGRNCPLTKSCKRYDKNASSYLVYTPYNKREKNCDCYIKIW